MSGPAGGDDGVDLRGAGDAQDGDGAVGGEGGRRVRAAFDFSSDFGAGGEQARRCQQLRGRAGGQQRGPGGRDVEGCRAAGRVEQADGVGDGLFGVGFEGGVEVREGGLPLDGVAEVALGADGTEPAAGFGDRRVQGFAELVG